MNENIWRLVMRVHSGDQRLAFSALRMHSMRNEQDNRIYTFTITAIDDDLKEYSLL